MPVKADRAWRNYVRARKPGGLNFSTFKHRYIEGRKYAQGARPLIPDIAEVKRLKKNQEFYMLWGGPQPDLSMPDDMTPQSKRMLSDLRKRQADIRSGFDSSAPIISGKYEGEEIRYRGNPTYESQMRRTRKYGN